MLEIKKIDAGVTAAKGFSAANCAAGIKYQGRDDMAMIYSSVPCAAAGTYTKNVVKAAPVMWDKQVTTSGIAQAVVCNAGIANACTGDEGMKMCAQTADAVAAALSVDANQVLIASTGVIGFQLPIDKLVNGVNMMKPLLSDSIDAGHKAAKAIMTTDTVSKEVACTVEIAGKTVTVGGMCKGSGMIHPNMCTMLAFVTTDCAIDQSLLQKALSTCIVDSFNMISVDGDTSTNDTCVVLANGLAENDKITTENADYDAFLEALLYVTQNLAKKMAADGEGATHLVECKVINADTKENARILAKSVICSSLVKSAVYGKDANWGRIACALGYSGVDFDQYGIDIYYESVSGKMLVCKNGSNVEFSEEMGVKILTDDEVTLICDMHMGTEEATAYGCDLTHEYVDINADYRS